MFKQQEKGRRRTWVLLASVALFAFTAALGWAQSTHPQPASQPSNQSLADQIQELREQINRLEQTLRQSGGVPAGPSSPAGGSAPSAGGSSKGGMAGMSKGEMAGMPMGEKGGMPMQEMGKRMQEMGMTMQGMGMNMERMGMGEMGGMAGSSSTASGTGAMGSMSGSQPNSRQSSARSALPGFPGASHLYHIGSTGFFLDHPEHITLTVEQQTRLNQIKEKTTLDNAAAQRRIDEAEQKLWSLTAADQPDQTGIDGQVREIERLRADQRLAYIRGVGEAAQVLTEQQRQALLGKVPMKASN
jgi:Spy/CpxP family protein refolding chaperone